VKYHNKADGSIIEATKYDSWDVGQQIHMHTDGFGSHYEQRGDERIFPRTGDYVITGLENRAFMVLKPDIFESAYEKIEVLPNLLTTPGGKK